MRNYYVYALIDPTNGLAFYIGKGKNNRCRQHAYLARAGSHHNAFVQLRIRQIQRAGDELVACKLFEGLSEDDAFKIERMLIQRIGRERLLNGANGYASKLDAYLDGCRRIVEIGRQLPRAIRVAPSVSSMLGQAERILSLPRSQQAFFAYDTVIIYADGTHEFK